MLRRMQLFSPRQLFYRLPRVPLWVVLVIPSILIIALTVSVTHYLSHRNSQAVVDDIAGQLITEIHDRIDSHLQTFFEVPHRINETNAIVIRQHLLDVSDMDAVGHYLWEQVQVHDTVTSIYFGNPQGGLVSSGREGADGSLYIINTANFASGELYKYGTDSSGNLTDLLVTVPQFDARTRPWYMGAVENADVNWTAPYVLSTGQDLAIASSLPVYDDSTGELIGVVSVDIFLSHIGNFLEDLQIGTNGQAYIVDHSGLLIAASTNNATVIRGDDSVWQRLAATESENPIIAATARNIMAEFGGFTDVGNHSRHTFEIEDEQHYLLVAPFHAVSGLDWLIVISIPRDDFLAEIDAQNQITLLLTVLAIVTAVIVSGFTAFRLSYPITRLSRVAADLARGDWKQKAPVRGVQETRLLGNAFNEMSGQLHGLFMNLEERIRERTQELASSEQRYRAVVEDQTELVCRFLPDYTLTFVNKSYCRFFGKSDEELVGTSFMPYIPDKDRPEIMQRLVTAHQQNAVITIEHRNIRFDREHRWMQWIYRALFDGSNQLIEFQAVGRDITEYKQFEQKLQMALEHEVELNELKSHFISTVSHEFRTPLAIILSSCQIMQRYYDKLDTERKAMHYNRIEGQIQRMTDLLDDVLIISRANMGKLEFVPEPVDIKVLCENAINEIRYSIVTNHTFDFAVAGDCTAVVADPRLMRLILTNLISNAAKYSPPDSVVSIELDCQPTALHFSIRDEGIGIPEAAQPRIFEPFFRATNVNSAPGTGLGLAIVKQSVEQHGGTLSVKSELNKGTTFTVILPNNTQGMLDENDSGD
jgi:PAS domain S-box-containing protein